MVETLSLSISFFWVGFPHPSVHEKQRQKSGAETLLCLFDLYVTLYLWVKYKAILVNLLL